MKKQASRFGGEQFLYLTTIGRRSGLPREIEIWFVESDGKFYVFAEFPEKANWVKNIARNPLVSVRVAKDLFKGNGRALDAMADRKTYELVRNLSNEKYGWGDGLPVEISPD